MKTISNNYQKSLKEEILLALLEHLVNQKQANIQFKLMKLFYYHLVYTYYLMLKKDKQKYSHAKKQDIEADI